MGRRGCAWASAQLGPLNNELNGWAMHPGRRITLTDQAFAVSASCEQKTTEYPRTNVQ